MSTRKKPAKRRTTTRKRTVSGGKKPAKRSRKKRSHWACITQRITPAFLKRGRKRKRREPVGWRQRILKWTAVTAIWGVVAMIGLFSWYAYDLPDIDKLGVIEKRPSVTIKAADGTILSSYGDVYGDYIHYDAMPWHLPAALIATEDRRFFEHYGIDPIGIARAMMVNFQKGRLVQGGSTLTQQLAKNVFLTPERTLRRKIQETMLALWLEHKFNKEEILTMYLNRVYFGAGSYGVDAAARRYFDKRVPELNIKESALLAGLLKAPSRYAPTRNLQRAEARANLVLTNMVAAGKLEPERALAAKKLPLVIHSYQSNSHNSFYFGDWVTDRLPGYIGHMERDIEVLTTVDPELQRMAEIALEEALAEQGDALNIRQGALVVMAPDGAVRAMVGGKSYLKSQYNRATQARRQPGSAFKPFVYLAAVEQGMTTESPVEDAPITIGKWQPGNYGGRYYGTIMLREALAKSANSVAARLGQQVGPKAVVAAAQRLGILSPLTAQQSISLGTNEVTLLELTGAYAHFANEGLAVWPHGVLEIRDRNGQVLYRRTSGGSSRVMSEASVAMMNDMMMRVIEEGTGRGAQIGRPAAGKTGTSQDFRDAWFVGYTPQLVAGVWVGNDNAAPMEKVTGGKVPAKIWQRFMTMAHRNLPIEYLPRRTSPGWVDSLFGFGSGPSARPAAPTPQDEQSVWDSIMDGVDEFNKEQDGEVKYEYPNQRRN